MVYVAYGGLYGDCGDYHGWVVAAGADDGAIRATYQVPSQREGAIWEPSGPAVDAAGDLYVSTGNSSTVVSSYDFGNAVIRLSPDLKMLDWFAPSNWRERNVTDADIGSTGPALLGDHLLFQIGKQGTGFLLRPDHLGQIGGQAFSAPVCASAFGGTAYASPLLYVPCSNGLVALRVDEGAPSFSVAWRGPDFFAGPPIVAGGVVWSIDRGAATLDGFDPRNGQNRFRFPLGGAPHFGAPAAGGRSIVASGGNRILAFSGVSAPAIRRAPRRGSRSAGQSRFRSAVA